MAVVILFGGGVGGLLEAGFCVILWLFIPFVVKALEDLFGGHDLVCLDMGDLVAIAVPSLQMVP